MFLRNCANTCYQGSSSGLLVKTTFLQMHTCNDYAAGRLTNSKEEVKQSKSPNSSRIQFLEADLDQEPSFVFRDQYILQQDLTLTRGPMGRILDTAIRCFRAIRVQLPNK